MNPYSKRWLKYFVALVVPFTGLSFICLFRVFVTYLLLLSFDSVLSLDMFWKFVSSYGSLLTANGILLGFSSVCITQQLRQFREVVESDEDFPDPEYHDSYLDHVKWWYTEFVVFIRTYITCHVSVLLVSIIIFPCLFEPSVTSFWLYGGTILLFLIVLCGFIVLVSETIRVPYQRRPQPYWAVPIEPSGNTQGGSK